MKKYINPQAKFIEMHFNENIASASSPDYYKSEADLYYRVEVHPCDTYCIDFPYAFATGGSEMSLYEVADFIQGMGRSEGIYYTFTEIGYRCDHYEG